jgi:hypothetical protein
MLMAGDSTRLMAGMAICSGTWALAGEWGHVDQDGDGPVAG